MQRLLNIPKLTQWLRRKASGKFHPTKRISPIQQWEWILPKPFGAMDSAQPPGTNTLTWFVPPVGRGSGGHLNIFRFIDMLEKRGFDCRIVICHETRTVSPENVRHEIADWFFPLQAPVYLHPIEDIPPTHFAVATGWQTAYPVRDFNGCQQRLYFVQDYEPWFQGAGAIASFAEATYHFRFPAITAGRWLADLLAEKYGMKTFAIGFGVDHDLYYPHPQTSPRVGKHVFFYARPPTERRGFQLGMLALSRLAALLPDVTVHFAGWPMDCYSIPFRHVDHGILPLEKLAELYSQCDVALVFSFSNISLLPLEIMACGCPVVSNAGANVEWLLNSKVAALTPADADAIALKLMEILTDPDLHHQLSDQGLLAAANSLWQREGEHVAEILQSLLPSEET